MARKKFVSITQKPTAAAVLAASEPTALLASALPFDDHAEGVGDGSKDVSDRDVAVTTNALGLALYGTVFCISYGLVFSAMVLGKFLPGSELIGRGLNDGARSAQRSFRSRAG